jgi:hypothetical protein
VESVVSEFYQQAAAFASLPGLGGALCSVLFGWRFGAYRNDRFLRKLAVECLGGTLLATFLGQIFQPTRLEVAASCCLGLSWVFVIQTLRKRATRLAEAALDKILKS